MVKRIKFKFIEIKAWTSSSCLIERLNSGGLSSKVAESLGASAGLVETPASSMGPAKGGRVRQTERTLHLECIMNVLLKSWTYWSRLKDGKFNSLRGEAADKAYVHVVVADEVVDEVSGSPEITSCSWLVGRNYNSQQKSKKGGGSGSWKTLKSVLDLRRQLLNDS